MAAGAAPAVADDVLLEIFARVRDPVDLLRCAGACRRWLRLIAADDPSFLLLRRAAGLSPPPEKKKKDLAARLLLARVMPAPLDRRELHLAVCHPLIGRRSTRLVPPPPLLDLDPELFGADLAGYALLLTDHRDHHHRHLRSPEFQVLITAAVHAGDQEQDKPAHHYAYCYSSAASTWRSAPIDCAAMAMRTGSSTTSSSSSGGGLTMSGPRAGVAGAHGTAQWLYRDETSFYTLGVAITAGDVPSASLTKIPIPVEQRDDPRRRRRLQPPFPCVSKGGRPNGVLELWTKRDELEGGDDDSRGWARSELIREEDHHQDQARGETLRTMAILGFAESRGALLVQINGGRYGDLVALDLESKEMEPVGVGAHGGGGSSFGWSPLCGWFRCRGHDSCDQSAYNGRVLYEMDWPSYLRHLCHSETGSTDRWTLWQIDGLCG